MRGAIGCLELLVGVDADGMPRATICRSTPARAIDVEGPLGSFTFPAAPEERRFVFIAGGTGIAPLRAMLRHALAIPHRNIGLLLQRADAGGIRVRARSFATLAAGGDIELRQTVTRASEAEWTGARGRMTRDALESWSTTRRRSVSSADRRRWSARCRRCLQDIGIPRERIRIEEWRITP